MKKIITMMLCITLFFTSFSVNVIAANNEEAGMIQALNAIEGIKDKVGLEGVDLEKLYYCDSIIAYEYTYEGIVMNSEFIPLMHENTLIGWIVKVSDGENIIYQYTNTFVDEINTIITENMEFAIIYDYNASYLYDGTNIRLLGNISVPVENRTTITNAEELEGKGIILNNVATAYALDYVELAKNARSQRYYECSVAYVTQNPYENLCWAASIASTLNLKKGTSYSAPTIAKAYWGSTTDFNYTVSASQVASILGSYGLAYEYRSSVPSSSVILNNIQRSYPIQIYCVNSDGGGHATVLYGIDVIGGYYYIMDPAFGFCSTTYSSSSGHTYVNPSTGKTFTLKGASCNSWSS